MWCKHAQTSCSPVPVGDGLCLLEQRLWGFYPNQEEFVIDWGLSLLSSSASNKLHIVLPSKLRFIFLSFFPAAECGTRGYTKLQLVPLLPQPPWMRNTHIQAAEPVTAFLSQSLLNPQKNTASAFNGFPQEWKTWPFTASTIKKQKYLHFTDSINNYKAFICVAHLASYP